MVTAPRTDDHLVKEAVRSALAAGTRPARPSPAATSGTFFWRAMLKIKHVPEQLFDVTMFPVMFLLMFTYLFGGALAGSPQAYLQEVLPGILAMTVLMITMYTGLSLNRDVDKGVFDRFKSLPIWRPSTLVGPLLADAVRYTIASTVILVLGVVLGFRPRAGFGGVLMAVGILLVFSFSLSWVWTALGIVMRSENALMGISMMILFPLTFISNVFVMPETMPSWLAAFVNVNPVTHLVTAMRSFMHGGVDSGAVGIILVWSAVLVAVFGPLTMYVYARKHT
ncbi:MAG TPA: ABC transporter permease [Acidimicrobiia bacterium]|nr:ABC transporter permease [Acidimicrobiia bacterium]